MQEPWATGLTLSLVGFATVFAVLTIIALLGLNAYCKQLVNGLVVTGMTDHVSWGVYIANFTFLVGVAAAAVMLVIPAYIFHRKDIKDVVLMGDTMAIVAVTMAIMFILVDLGRPDRIWHLIPGIGKFHFPESMLAWDSKAHSPDMSP